MLSPAAKGAGGGWAAAILALVVAVVYGNTFANDWTYDDYFVIMANPAVRSLAGLLEKGLDWRCLRDLSLAIDHALWGSAPAGYHLQQLLLHWANAVLIFSFCVRHGCRWLPALGGSLFFIVHPLQVESVANISHRKEALALIFVLLLLHAYRSALRAAGTARRGWLAAALLAYGAALLANETAVTAIFLPLAYEALLLPPAERLLLRRPLVLALCGLLAGGLGVWYLQRHFPLAGQILKVFSKNGYYATPAYLPLLLGCLQVVALYAGKLLLPLKLAPEYVISFSASPWQPLALAGLLIGAGLLVVIGLSRRRQPFLAFGLVAGLLLYLPIANLYPVAYMMADRYLYLPLAGLALALAAACEALAPGRLSRLAMVVVLLALALLSIRQNTVWRSEHSLWRHAVQVNPRSSAVQGAAARSYLRQGDLAQALIHGSEAIRLDRQNVGAYLTLARAEERTGNLPAAVGHYATFVALGAREFPRETAEAAAYLPYLQRRLQRGE